ncbi:YrdB family protein [Actinomadura barringtoniae]|uniref:YrdB family protein n=1 Tax=Actinomadura barringtoniae TaxID=1427535 RepID=A0A939T5C8_9ACTN|nr:YrdB family protein [Actinomadura barringtoniae]
MHMTSEGLSLLLEVVAVFVLAWWGFGVGDNAVVHVILGVGAPLAAMALWGAFAAPKAKIKAPLPVVLLVKLIVFGAAALAFYALDQVAVAVIYAAIAILSIVLAALDSDAAYSNGDA